MNWIDKIISDYKCALKCQSLSSIMSHLRSHGLANGLCSRVALLYKKDKILHKIVKDFLESYLYKQKINIYLTYTPNNIYNHHICVDKLEKIKDTIKIRIQHLHKMKELYEL